MTSKKQSAGQGNIVPVEYHEEILNKINPVIMEIAPVDPSRPYNSMALHINGEPVAWIESAMVINRMRDG